MDPAAEHLLREATKPGHLTAACELAGRDRYYNVDVIGQDPDTTLPTERAVRYIAAAEASEPGDPSNAARSAVIAAVSCQGGAALDAAFDSRLGVVRAAACANPRLTPQQLLEGLEHANGLILRACAQNPRTPTDAIVELIRTTDRRAVIISGAANQALDATQIEDLTAFLLRRISAISAARSTQRENARHALRQLAAHPNASEATLEHIIATHPGHHMPDAVASNPSISEELQDRLAQRGGNVLANLIRNTAVMNTTEVAAYATHEAAQIRAEVINRRDVNDDTREHATTIGNHKNLDGFIESHRGTERDTLATRFEQAARTVRSTEQQERYEDLTIWLDHDHDAISDTPMTTHLRIYRALWHAPIGDNDHDLWAAAAKLAATDNPANLANLIDSIT